MAYRKSCAPSGQLSDATRKDASTKDRPTIDAIRLQAAENPTVTGPAVSSSRRAALHDNENYPFSSTTQHLADITSPMQVRGGDKPSDIL